jgi:CRISPR-associated protein Cmr6
MPALPPDTQCHPGLLLDKWHDPWSGDKTFARDQLKRVTVAAPDHALLRRVRSRFAEVTPACVRWTGRTSGPLTLHLSRAGSFENAGICLHPVYGFAYLPGTGLKGMARAYARNLARAAPAEMEEVFGKDVSREDDGAAGAVVFYDALPVQWPKLIVDIVNNHHGGYYNGENAAGDWEEPVPVNFLAVSPGTDFEFCLGVRRSVVDSNRALKLAKEWIDGALLWFGAGAKTNAGYGRFSTGVALPTGGAQTAVTCTLTLGTPGFLAGALQEADDCTLRAATLRGLLRWWWRTMHAGHLPTRDLLKLERIIWGGTAGSDDGEASVLGISLEPVEAVTPIRYSKQDVARAHELKKPDRQKATLGIAYISYGMDEKDRSRYYAPEGSRWKLTMVANSAGVLSNEQVLDQAKSALWLLTNFGGVGSKGRKGFGSLEKDAGVAGLEECRRHAADVRAAMRSPNQQSGFLRESPSLENILGPIELTLPGDDVWWTLDQLGDATQEFAQSYKHRIEKKALGLPRKMKEADSELRSLSRHASPMHFHVSRDNSEFKADSGCVSVREAPKF